MATYAPTQHTAAAATFIYAIGFDYERTDDVRVYINGIQLARGTTTSTWRYNGAGNINIQLGTNVNQQDDDIILIKRVTDITDAATIYTNGSGFTHTDINTLANQLLYAIDELQVPAYEKTFTLALLLASGAIETHGLGAVPARFTYTLICTNSDLSYTVDDILNLSQAPEVPTLYFNATLFVADKENWDAVEIQHANNGTRSPIDPDDWSLIVRAWR
jgi:hypothetical protein